MKTLKSLAVLFCFGALMCTTGVSARAAQYKNALIAQNNTSNSSDMQTTQPDANSQATTPATTDQSAQPNDRTNATDTTNQQTTDQSSSNSNLPQTASDLPLVALIGFLSLAGAASIRVLAKASDRA